VQELIALAKAKPDQLLLRLGRRRQPAAPLAGELFKVMAGVRLTHVPYAGGSGQAATDLIAGRISMVFSPASTIAPHIAAGSVKALAAATAKARRPVSRPTDHCGGRPARFRFRHLGRADGAGRYAAPGDRPACARGR
jgi:tripartite-type tricarboxylate transporter receptor subunit TctC